MGDRLIFTDRARTGACGGQSITTGALAAVNLAQLRGDPRVVASGASPVIFEPNARQSVKRRGHHRRPRGRQRAGQCQRRPDALRVRRPAAGRRPPLPTPDNVSVSLARLQPRPRGPVLLRPGLPDPLDPVPGRRGERRGPRSCAKARPASTPRPMWWSSSVASTDGTEIPYFLVRPRDQAAGRHRRPPSCSATAASRSPCRPATRPRWASCGWSTAASMSMANIRGGGEFGPGWHQAALKENRQRAFDDFAAVARGPDRRGASPRPRASGHLRPLQRRGADLGGR